MGYRQVDNRVCMYVCQSNRCALDRGRLNLSTSMVPQIFRNTLQVLGKFYQKSQSSMSLFFLWWSP